MVASTRERLLSADFFFPGKGLNGGKLWEVGTFQELDHSNGLCILSLYYTWQLEKEVAYLFIVILFGIILSNSTNVHCVH